MRFTLGLLVFVPVFSQTSPDAAALLAGSASELQRYHSYQFTQDMTMEVKMPGMSMPPMSYTTVTQVVNPGKSRVETTIAGMPGMLMISDGKDTWMYMPLLKQYSKLPGDGPADMQSVMGGMGTSAIPDLKEMTANAKVVRSETLEVDGQQRDCWVIESRTDKLAMPGQPGAAMQDMAYTSWIDKSLGIQLKMSVTGKIQADAVSPAVAMSTVTTMHSMKFNEIFPDSQFVFMPPADAKETKELFPGMGAIVGSTPPVPAAEAKSAPKPQPGEPEAFIPMLNPIDRIEPDYPPEARSQGLKGDVDVLVTIDPAGAVVKAEALTGREILRPAAIDAVKQWRFRPVYRDGHPVSAYTQASVVFWLDSKTPGKNAEDLAFDLAGQMQSSERIRELTDHFPRSPGEVLADSEEQIRGRDGEDRFYMLRDLPKQALDAGALDKASSYAIELLELAKEDKDQRNFGDEIYNGNTVLGLVSLRQGSVSEARRYLLESVKTPGSPVLDSFGPDLTLARELLEHGERDAVLEYLTLCKGFWKTGADRLDAMAAEVRKGGTL